jgi:hypothetical protein
MLHLLSGSQMPGQFSLLSFYCYLDSFHFIHAELSYYKSFVIRFPGAQMKSGQFSDHFPVCMSTVFTSTGSGQKIDMR